MVERWREKAVIHGFFMRLLGFLGHKAAGIYSEESLNVINLQATTMMTSNNRLDGNIHKEM